MIYVAIAAVIIIAIFLLRSSKPVEEFVLTEEFKTILNILNNTTESVFISGKAGTGKSTLLKYFIAQNKKKVVVLAPTGVAAMNVKGQTVHSFFRFRTGLLQEKDIKLDYPRNALFKSLEMVIIDEISMVSANLLEAVDIALRKNRDKPDVPFGGVQMVFIGDLFQLPPVVIGDLKAYFKANYGGVYFFDCPALKNGFAYKKIELQHVFRQKDEDFKLVLNRVRVNEAGFDDFVKLNARHVDNVGEGSNEAVFLTTTNANVKTINKINLGMLGGREFVYKAEMTGKIKEGFDQVQQNLNSGQINESQFEDSVENKFPTNVMLKLKEGAQIMMIKNDGLKRWVNGSVGKVSRLDENNIWVKLEGKTYQIEKEKWEDIVYAYDARTNEIKEITKGVFRQFPVKLAWAMTIHKSQGKTFDKVVIDIGNGAFSTGQTYVALSRCKTLEGITLNREIKETDVMVDERVVEYYGSV